MLHAVQAVVARLARTLLDASNPDASNPDPSERDFDRAVDRALAEVGELIRAARAYVFVIEGSRTSNTHEWCGPGVTPQRDNLQHLAVEDFEVFFSPLRSRKPLYVPCVAELPDQDATKGVLEAQGIQRLLAVPMHRGGALSGFVGIDDPKVDLRGPTDLVEPLVLLADVLSAAFAHRARQTAFEEERAWRALVLNGSSAILYSASFPDFRVDFVSDSIRAVLGVEPEEARAPGFWVAALHPDDRERVLAGLSHLVSTGAHVHEYRCRHADGSYRWLRDEVRLLSDERGRTRAVGASFDMTERKLGESRHASLLTIQQIISRVSAGFLDGGTNEEKIDAALAALGQHARGDRAYVFRIDGRLADNTHEWCRDGISPQKTLLQRMPAEDFAFFTKPFREGRPLWIPSVDELPEEAAVERESFRAQGIDRLLAVPMLRSGTLLGFLGIDNPRVAPLEPLEFAALLQHLADTLATGLERSEEQRALRELNLRLVENTSRQTALLTLSTKLSRTSFRPELFAALRNSIEPIVRVESLSVLEKIPGGRYRVHVVAARSEREGPSEFEVHDLDARAAGRSMSSRATITTRDLCPSAFDDWSSLRARHDVVQFVVIPLFRDGEVVGTLDAAFSRTEPPTAEEVEWLSQIAMIVAAQLAVIHGRESLERLNLALEERVEQRTRDLRASEERFERLFRLAPQAMLLVDGDGRVDAANHAALELFDYRAAELVGRTIEVLVPETVRGAHQLLRTGAPSATLESTKSRDRVFSARRHDGTTFQAQIRLVPVVRDQATSVIVGINDVTEARSAMAALRASVSEKETMIKEIHHRVKNNLQIVSSLLQMQVSKVGDPTLAHHLRESVGRIQSMAMVHQSLYQEEVLDRVDVGAYARRLVDALRATIAPRARVLVETDRTEVGIDVAIPLGLILNELLTNALKYGLPDPPALDVPWDVSVKLESDAGGFAVSVADRGPGLPSLATLEQTSTLGLRLVRALAAQIGAGVRYERDVGARFVVTRTPVA